MLYFKRIKRINGAEVEREVIPCNSYTKITSKDSTQVCFRLELGKGLSTTKRLRKDGDYSAYIENDAAKTIDSFSPVSGGVK